MPASLSTAEIARELAAYSVELSEPRLQQLSTYLELLLRWNRRVNLTALRQPRQIVRRLFGESLYLAEVLELKGWLVDVGCGAGFPGLALKLAVPDLRVTLVESRRKKCTFLKEVARECGFENVEVVGERLEAWAAGLSGAERAAVITTRAVAVRKNMLATIRNLLAPGGKGVFLTTTVNSEKIQRLGEGWRWHARFSVPDTERSVVLVGGCY